MLPLHRSSLPPAVLAGLLALLTGCGGSTPTASTTTTSSHSSRTSSSTSASTDTTETQSDASSATAAIQGTSVAGHKGKLGDRLETDGFKGEHVAVTVTTVIDPADSTMTAEHYQVSAGKRAVIVKSVFTNLGSQPYHVPDLNVVLVDPGGAAYDHSIAVLNSCPSYPGEVAAGQTASGCTVFEVPKTVKVVSVQWSPRPDLLDRTLTWTLA